MTIRKKIEGRRGQKGFFGFLVFIKDFFWDIYVKIINFFKKLKVFLEWLKSYFYGIIYRRINKTRDNLILKNLIQDKRILILGSGSSASELGNVPKDVLVFTCNAGVRLLNKKKINKIDLYLTRKNIINKTYSDLKNSLSGIKIKIFMIDNLWFIKKNKNLKISYFKLLFDDGFNNIYLKKLIKPHNLKEIKSNKDYELPWTSSGMRLLQYALYFKAKEIYLIGIDLGKGNYFWGKKNWKHKHSDIDENFLKIVSKKYDNIFSASKKSPITEYFKYKKL